MTRIEKWLLRRILRNQLQQGPTLGKRITELYQEIRSAYERQYYEDNVFTVNVNLRDWFEDSQKLPPQATGQRQSQLTASSGII